jgi:hypothetical protein
MTRQAKMPSSSEKCLCVSKTESYGLSRICFEMTRQATMPSSKAWLCLADEQHNRKTERCKYTWPKCSFSIFFLQPKYCPNKLVPKLFGSGKFQETRWSNSKMAFLQFVLITKVIYSVLTRCQRARIGYPIEGFLSYWHLYCCTWHDFWSDSLNSSITEMVNVCRKIVVAALCQINPLWFTANDGVLWPKASSQAQLTWRALVQKISRPRIFKSTKGKK